MKTKVTYDASEDAAYISFYNTSSTPETLTQNSTVTSTYCCDLNEVGWMINIDFMEDGRIFWIELIPASLYLSQEVLKNALS